VVNLWIMTTGTRLATEQAFHDRQAQQRAADLVSGAQSLVFTDDVYLDHETWVGPAFRQLGDIKGKRVLDLGSGHGMAAVVLARRGGRVTALDLSAGYLAEARSRAKANHVAIDFVKADAEKLPFVDGAFDLIWGSAILHHLKLEQAAAELARVLSPGGTGVFCEPWGENPLLGWIRRRVSYPGKERTPDEQPLRWFQVDILRRMFSSVSVQGYQLLSMAARLVGRRRLLTGLDWCDRMLLAGIPRLQHYCRYVVLTVRR
jgi:ubiquinone/menaquinone biosynthesis C-methylase UbiE